jgi:hypothetical protein
MVVNNHQIEREIDEVDNHQIDREIDEDVDRLLFQGRMSANLSATVVNVARYGPRRVQQVNTTVAGDGKRTTPYFRHLPATSTHEPQFEGLQPQTENQFELAPGKKLTVSSSKSNCFVHIHDEIRKTHVTLEEEEFRFLFDTSHSILDSLDKIKNKN